MQRQHRSCSDLPWIEHLGINCCWCTFFLLHTYPLWPQDQSTLSKIKIQSIWNILTQCQGGLLGHVISSSHTPIIMYGAKHENYNLISNNIFCCIVAFYLNIQTCNNINKYPPLYPTDKQCGSRNVCIHHATKARDV